MSQEASKIRLNLNLSQIDKSQIYEGKKGKYLSLTVIPTPDSAYNDFMLVQYVKGSDNIICGNGDRLEFDDDGNIIKREDRGNSKPKAAPVNVENTDDDLPF